MLEGAKPEGTSDVACSRNQPSLLGDDRERCHPRLSDRKRIAEFRRPLSRQRRPGEPPGTAGGSCSCSRVDAYRLTWRLAPPLGPLAGPLPRTSPVETSLTQSEPLPL